MELDYYFFPYNFMIGIINSQILMDATKIFQSHIQKIHSTGDDNYGDDNYLGYMINMKSAFDDGWKIKFSPKVIYNENKFFNEIVFVLDKKTPHFRFKNDQKDVEIFIKCYIDDSGRKISRDFSHYDVSWHHNEYDVDFNCVSSIICQDSI